MNPNVYRWCAVPQCNNTSIKAPNKIFVNVPMKKNIRNMWLKLAKRDPTVLSSKSVIYFCEDHFDLPKDMENYTQYRVMGSVPQVRMKSGCIPTKFECQSDRRKRTSDITERPYVLKKQRKTLIEECKKYLAEKSTSTKHFEPAGISSENLVLHTIEEGPTTYPKSVDKSVQNRPTSPEIDIKDEPLDIKDEPIQGTSGTNHLEPVDVNVEPSGTNKNMAPFEIQFDDNNRSKNNYEIILKSEPVDPSDTNHNQEESEILLKSIKHSTEHSVSPVYTLFDIIIMEPNDSEQIINENTDPLNYSKNKVSSNSNQNDLKIRRANFAAFGKKIAEHLELFPVDYVLILQEKIENLITEEKQKLMLI